MDWVIRSSTMAINTMRELRGYFDFRDCPRPDQGPRGGPGVLGQRQDVLVHEGHALDGAPLGRLLVLRRVDAVEKAPRIRTSPS